MSGGGFTIERATRIGVSKDCVVKVPADDELFIDIDSEEAYEQFHDLGELFDKIMPGSVCSSTASKSGWPRQHIIVKLPRPVKDATERVLLQALLGSDLRREMLSWGAIEAGTTTVPTLFFEKVA